MRRTHWILAAVALVVLLYWAADLLKSDEDRIRGLLLDATESFDATRLSGALHPLAEEFRTTGGLTREQLAGGLRYAFLTMVDGKEKRFRYRLRLPEDSLSIVVTEGDPNIATANFELDLQRRQGDAWSSEWQLRVQARLRATDQGWRIMKSSHQTASGRRPR